MTIHYRYSGGRCRVRRPFSGWEWRAGWDELVQPVCIQPPEMSEDIRAGAGSHEDAVSDEQLVDRVRAGDIAKYELLNQRYSQRLYRIARAIVRNEHEAEDIVQETFVRAYAHLEQFRGDAKSVHG